MAYNNNAAYDLTLFDEENTYSSAAPKRREEEPVKKPKKKVKNNVVEFSEEDKLKARRRKHNPFKLLLGGSRRDHRFHQRRPGTAHRAQPADHFRSGDPRGYPEHLYPEPDEARSQSLKR